MSMVQRRQPPGPQMRGLRPGPLEKVAVVQFRPVVQYLSGSPCHCVLFPMQTRDQDDYTETRQQVAIVAQSAREAAGSGSIHRDPARIYAGLRLTARVRAGEGRKF
jgi:hypothetical protein